jgi:hypothetical protein
MPGLGMLPAGGMALIVATGGRIPAAAGKPLGNDCGAGPRCMSCNAQGRGGEASAIIAASKSEGNETLRPWVSGGAYRAQRRRLGRCHRRRHAASGWKLMRGRALRRRTKAAGHWRGRLELLRWRGHGGHRGHAQERGLRRLLRRRHAHDHGWRTHGAAGHDHCHRDRDRDRERERDTRETPYTAREGVA